MAFEVPVDLIRQVQIALRNDADLSDYDPDDPTLPSLPSLDASIATLDPSPAYLRCKQCGGKLLRGIQSLICIYCGKQQQQTDLPPEPISFTSTFAYRWLLQSLDLDESETVGPSTEETESKRGQITSKEEISLHDLLDLQIKWSNEVAKPVASVTNRTLEQSDSSLNLAGVDLDNIFSGSKRDVVYDASEEQSVITKEIVGTEINTSVGQESLSLFSNFPSAHSAVRSSEDNSGDAFSGWDADFQSSNQHEDSKSFDPFAASTIDLSTHMESVFGSGKDIISEKLEYDSTPAPSVANDWFQDDPWKNVGSKVSEQESECFDLNVQIKDGHSPENMKKTSSKGVDWFVDNQWQTSVTSAPKNDTFIEQDDSFDEWNDFTSSSGAQDPSGNAWKHSDNQTAAVNEKTSETNLISSMSNFQDADLGSFSQPDFFSGSLGIQNAASVANDIHFEIPSSYRIDNAESKVETAMQNEGVLNSTTQVKDDAEILMSQMHDLSFMLESNLSVPSRLEERNSTTQD